jgi:hypothetical protein
MTHTPEKWYVGYGHVFTVTGEDQVEIIAEHIRDEKTAHQIKAIPGHAGGAGNNHGHRR